MEGRFARSWNARSSGTRSFHWHTADLLMPKKPATAVALPKSRITSCFCMLAVKHTGHGGVKPSGQQNG